MRKKYILLSLLLLIPALVFALTYEWVIDQMEYADDDAAQLAYVSSDVIDANTKLLIQFNGTDGAQVYTAETGQTVTFEVTAQLDTAQKKFGTASLLVDGDSDYVTVPDSADWYFNTGDFTIDFWVRFNSANSGTRLGFVAQKTDGTNWWRFHREGDNKLAFESFVGGTYNSHYYATNTWLPSLNTWYHLAVVRNGTTCYIFIGGVSQAVTEDVQFTSIPDYLNPLIIGRGVTVDFLNGWIDGFRISKGIARWTANFTPVEYPHLQSYSESTIKQQGSYSLKGIAVQTYSLNDTLTKTLTGTDKLDLTNAETIEYDIYALRTGSNIKLSIHDSGGTTTEHTANVASSNTNQTESWDISGVSDVNKDDIDEVKITITNADANNTFFLDDIKWGITAVSGGSWTFVN